MANSKFPQWLKDLRRRRRLTQVQAAVQIGVDGCTVNRWESGAEPKASHFPALLLWAKIPAKKLIALFER